MDYQAAFVGQKGSVMKNFALIALAGFVAYLLISKKSPTAVTGYAAPQPPPPLTIGDRAQVVADSVSGQIVSVANQAAQVAGAAHQVYDTVNAVLGGRSSDDSGYGWY